MGHWGLVLVHFLGKVPQTSRTYASSDGRSYVEVLSPMPVVSNPYLGAQKFPSWDPVEVGFELLKQEIAQNPSECEAVARGDGGLGLSRVTCPESRLPSLKAGMEVGKKLKRWSSSQIAPS